MYNSLAPHADSMADYDYVAKSRNTTNHSRLMTIREAVRSSYVDYYSSAPDVDMMASGDFTESDRKLLKGNYSRLNTNQPCSDIRDKILAQTKYGRCPYCCLEDASTLDHILEKSSYPEFATLRINLAPVCPRCNTIKQTNSHLVKSRRRLHLYFHGYPMSRYLISSVAIGKSSVAFKFSLTAPNGIDPDWWDALEAHFISLDLAARYQQRAQAEMQDRRHEMRKLHESMGPQGVSTFLRRYARSRALNWSEQDWLYVLLSDAAEDSDFCSTGVLRL